MPITRSASRARMLAPGVPVTPIAPEARGMVEGQRALAGLGLADRDAGRLGEAARSASVRLAVEHAAAGDDQRPLGRADQLGRARPAASASRRGRADLPDALLEERLRDSRRPRSARPAGSASVTAPVSAGLVSTRIASGSAVTSCSGRLMRSQ